MLENTNGMKQNIVDGCMKENQLTLEETIVIQKGLMNMENKRNLCKKALVLSSGGVDSTTCVGIAVKDVGSENVSTVSVFYGQKHNKELECAEKVAEFYNVKHYVLDLSNVLQYSNCSLMKNSTEEIPMMSYADQIKKNGEGKVSTYVPFRNGLMLSAVAALAQSIYPNDDVDIYLGAHADDAAGRAYADCSEEFTSAMNTAYSLYNRGGHQGSRTQR